MMWFDALAIHPPPEPLESLTGYLVRLAELNAIRSKSALSAVAFPRLQRKANWTDLPRVSYGALPDAANCTDAQVHATTFYHLLRKFQRSVYPGPAKIFLADVLVADLRYCPLCLRETNYYRLSWRFTHLMGCTQHNVHLLDRCGHCDAPVPLVPSPLRIGMCPTCGGDLRDCETGSVNHGERSLLRMVSDDLTFLLTPQPWETASVPIQTFGPTLAQTRRNLGWKRQAFAHHLGMSAEAFQAIEGRRAVGRGETFKHYLDYLAVFGLSFCDGFAQAQDDETDTEARWIERVRWAVAALEREGKPLTQQAICRLLQCKPKTLKPYSGVQTVLCELGIRQPKRQSAQRSNPKRSAEFDQREEGYLAQVKTVVEQIEAEGGPYSRREVARRMGMSGPGLCHYPHIAAFLTDRLETARATEHAAWHERVVKAAAHLQGQGQPVTQRAVARLLGISAERLRYHADSLAYLATFADYNTELHTRQQQARETTLYEAVTEVIRQLNSGGQRVTQVAVAAALDTSVQCLKFYDSIRPVMEAIANHAKPENTNFFRS
jgi:transcriptional regulator with XRE-family HTH domain